MLSSTLKSLIIHTADEAGPNPGPDYSFGWGLMNTHKAAQTIKDNYYRGGIHIYENTLANGLNIEYQVESFGSKPLTATIC